MNRAEIAWWIDAAARLLADEAEQPAIGTREDRNASTDPEPPAPPK